MTTTVAVKRALSRISKIENELQLLKRTISQTMARTDDDDWIKTSEGKSFLAERVKQARRDLKQGKAVSADELRKELGL